MLRIRCEPDLKRRINRIAKARRKRAAALTRDWLWQMVDGAEAAGKNAA